MRRKMVTGEIWMNHTKIFTEEVSYNSNLLNEIDAMKEVLDKSLTKVNFEKIWKIDMHSNTHHSTAIEGNKLEQHDSEILYDTYGAWKSEELFGITQEEFQKTLKSKCSKKDCLEVLLHLNAYQYTEKLFTSKGLKNLIEEDIIHLNTCILGCRENRRVEVQNLGMSNYRRIPVHVRGSSTVRPYPWELPAIMNKFIEWTNYELERKKYHPVVLSAQIHSKFLHIHPFSDGNGRTARLLLLLSTCDLGYYGVKIHKQNRSEYMNLLEELQNGKPKFYYDFILKNNLDFMKSVLEKLNWIKHG